MSKRAADLGGNDRDSPDYPSLAPARLGHYTACQGRVAGWGI
jgi:hypothetical protein